TVYQHNVGSALVRGWLDLCAECHSGHCAPIPRTEPRKFNFRVIDVVHSQVVSAPDDCMYAALSYVWGPATQVMNKKDVRTTLTSPGGMDHLPIPQTIRDSMEFCKAIGYTYLWVDALCIEQDEPGDLGSQIAAMDQVYSDASFTIVAAAGTHCDFGLPGFNGSRDFVQHASAIAGTVYLTTQRSPSLDALTSKWNTRGWT
ncbi:HET-domain-containing protein, partial [Byssothecium circinans]